jgi:hypothetical protein
VKPKTLFMVAAGGFFLVAFARDGTLVKGVKQIGGLANTVTGGYAKTARRI